MAEKRMRKMKISWGRKRQFLCHPRIRAVYSLLSAVYCWNMEKASLEHGILSFIRHPVLRMLQDRLLYLALCVLALAHINQRIW